MSKRSDIYTLAELFGGKGITNNSFTRSPSGLRYLSDQQDAQDAEELLKSTQTPLGSLSAGIGYYIQSKRKQKALDELSAELQAESAKKEQERFSLADELGVGRTLDMDTLQKIAYEKYKPQDPNAALDRQYKQASINKLNRENSIPINLQTGQPVKPLPVQALKAQNEGLDTIGTLSGINADLGAVEKEIDSGKLKLGPVDNLLSRAKNYTGFSDESSRNFASFKSTLEKQRNDSLRLNKGVQTEGDAVRAWNELFQNINDPKLVKQRLGEIRKINSRGADLQKLNVDQIRANYGAEPLDYSQYESRPAAIGNQRSAPQGQANGGFKILSIRNK